MKRPLLLLLCLLCSTITMAQDLPYGYPESDRTKELLNLDWRFHLGDADAALYATNTATNDWEQVSIPHTLKLTDIKLGGCRDNTTQPTFNRTVGWYRKDIVVKRSNKKIYLEFEGAQQITTLWVNGKKVGTHNISGYTPFYFDITKYVKMGKSNQITIMVDNRKSETTPPDPGTKDYVVFGGLYRDLYLVEKNPVHITSNLDSKDSGITITTPSVDPVNGNATIDICTEVRNESSKNQSLTLTQRVVDREGNVVLKMNEHFTLEAGELYHATQTGGINKDVRLWDIEYPYLYKVNTTLYNNVGKVIDVVDNRLGIRKVEIDPDAGLRLNGKPLLLVGFNRHQNYPYIGDAAPNSLAYRDMVQFKQLGLNIIRTSHYPHDDEIIRACDELGILVYEEAPSWHTISNDEGWYANYQKAAQAMIRNHKNSPSVIIWGAGINHRGAVAEMQFLTKQEDPTRITASQNSRWNGDQTSSWTDLFVNMNYAAGVWEREEPQLAMEGWGGAKSLAPYFREPKRMGMISWSAYAYYSFQEVSLPSLEDRTHSSGYMDIFRYPRKSDLMWYPSQMKLKPYIYVCDDWTEELKMLTVFSNATEIEIFVNDKSQGRYRPSNSLIYNGLTRAPFEIRGLTYEPGELRVVGYREGEVMAEKSVYTPSEATALRLFADKLGIDKLRADGNDIMILHAEVVDKNGMVLREFEGDVKFSISGDASIVGDEIGEGFNPAKVRVGAASALLRAGKSIGKIEVTASCEGLTPSTITLESESYMTNMVKKEAYPIYDTQTVKVDLGNETQTTQFGWTPWISTNRASCERYIDPAELTQFIAGDTPSAASRSKIVRASSRGAYLFRVAPASTDGQLNWSGYAEAMARGRDNNLFADGVLCSGKEGLKLSISALPAGRYTLKTYHHSLLPNNLKSDISTAELKKIEGKSTRNIPYSRKISASVDGAISERGVVVTDGNTMQYDPISTITTDFTITPESAGSVELLFKSEDETLTGVWLNGFELIRHL